MRLLHINCLVLLLHICRWTHAEVFTAITDLEPLLETYKRIIDDLDNHIQKEQKRLHTLKLNLDLYKEEHARAMEDIPNYLGNPINAFTLIKRLTTDLDFIEHSIKNSTEYSKNVTMNHEDVEYPTQEDLTGAAQALTRLQDTYSLDVRELSEGILNGVTYSTPMTAGDCYELGRVLYNDKDYENSLSWMKEALRKYNSEEIRYSFTEVDILECIASTYYLLDNIEPAIDWTHKLLAIDPLHPRAQGNISYYQKNLAEKQAKLKKIRSADIEDEEEDEPAKTLSLKEKERQIYEALCRGEMVVPQEIAKMLKCWYHTENHSFLKLAPIKVEQLYIAPDVFIFYEVMSDNEIELIKEMAKPRFERAAVEDPATGDPVKAHFRISKAAWLDDKESPVIARISQRVTDMTGLSMDYAEYLQVVNYGIGGYYKPHYDFVRLTESSFVDFGGNRIATVLFYMSDVAEGGATVFIELGLSVFPVKRAAAFWLNLHPSGEKDLSTLHAACPVLRGSKWVSNKWIHQSGQELLRPCNLEFQEEGIIRKIPRSIPKSSR